MTLSQRGNGTGGNPRHSLSSSSSCSLGRVLQYGLGTFLDMPSRCRPGLLMEAVLMETVEADPQALLAASRELRTPAYVRSTMSEA